MKKQNKCILLSVANLRIHSTIANLLMDWLVISNMTVISKVLPERRLQHILVDAVLHKTWMFCYALKIEFFPLIVDHVRLMATQTHVNIVHGNTFPTCTPEKK